MGKKMKSVGWQKYGSKAFSMVSVRRVVLNKLFLRKYLCACPEDHDGIDEGSTRLRDGRQRGIERGLFRGLRRGHAR